jgi:hypothetical protein
MELLAKDPTSGRNGCPSVHLDDNGDFVVLAPEVESGTLARLENVLPGERAVRMRPEVVLAAVEQYRARMADDV